MKIYEGTGVLSATCTPVTKAVGTMILTSNKRPDEFVNQKISIEIERVGAVNQPICTNVPLRDFIMTNLAMTGNRVVGVGGNYVSILALGVEANIQLKDGEKLLIKLTTILAADIFKIEVMEEVVSAPDYLTYEQKSAVVGELDKTFQTSDYQYCVFPVAGINEIGIATDLSEEARFTPSELQMLCLEDRDFYCIKGDGTVITHDTTTLVLPLASVRSLRFYRDVAAAATVITFLKFAELPAVVTPVKLGGLKR